MIPKETIIRLEAIKINLVSLIADSNVTAGQAYKLFQMKQEIEKMLEPFEHISHLGELKYDRA